MLSTMWHGGGEGGEGGVEGKKNKLYAVISKHAKNRGLRLSSYGL